MFKNYFEISNAQFRAQLAKQGNTNLNPTTFLSDKEGIPEFLRDYMKMYEETNNKNVFEEIFSHIHDTLQTPPNRMVLLKDGSFYCGIANDTVHHYIIAKLLYDGLIRLDEEGFKKWDKRKPSDFICLTQSQKNHDNWFISESYVFSLQNIILQDQNEFYLSRFRDLLKDINKHYKLIFEEE